MLTILNQWKDGVNNMNALQAKNMVDKHVFDLNNPRMEEINRFIENAAKQGGSKLFYGVGLQIAPNRLKEILESLKSRGFTVNEIPQEKLLALEISW